MRVKVLVQPQACQRLPVSPISSTLRCTSRSSRRFDGMRLSWPQTRSLCRTAEWHVGCPVFTGLDAFETEFEQVQFLGERFNQADLQPDKTSFTRQDVIPRWVTSIR